MNTDSDQLEKLGFDNGFWDQADPSLTQDLSLARVISVNKNNYVISNGRNEVFAELTGKFLFDASSLLDFPAAGDWVFVRLLNDDTFAVIIDILPRKSVLKRKSAGNKIDYQIIAANIDSAIIIQSLDSNYNLRRLERYLVMVNENNIQPIVLLSKSDLISNDEIEKKKSDILKIFPEINIIAFSSKIDSTIEEVERILIPRKTFCLLGSSGVGKTTLVNRLLKEELFRTADVREKDDRGKHTTTHRELIVLPGGAIIIDNPGMRELGIITADSGIDETFVEFVNLSKQCQFTDCTHIVEKGCAVLNAVETGEISKERYNNYIKIYKESLYNEMSYFEKRQKDKQFGKHVNAVMKFKKDKRL
jgi:ribosome biogenesis GTPase / thiamine phosphate phosphatase